MNNYYTLIYLTEYINTKLKGSTFGMSISPHKNVWEGYLEPEKGEPVRLVFSAAQGEIALFCDRYRPAKKNNVVQFFTELEGVQTDGVSLAGKDRFITIQMADGSSLLVQMFGHNANLFRVRNGRIEDAFRNRQQVIGTAAPEPRAPATGDLPAENPGSRKLILSLDPTFPRHLIQHVIEHYDLQQAPPEQVQQTLERLRQAMHREPEFRMLESGELCLIPFKLLPAANQKVFSDINEAVRYTYRTASHLRRFSKKRDRYSKRISNEIKRVRKALNQLEGAEKALERADSYEKKGHILMAHAHLEAEGGSDRIQLNDIYHQDRKIDISIKPELTLAENAQRYYERAAKARRRVEENKKRNLELQKQHTLLENLATGLKKAHRLQEIDDWEKENRERLNETGIRQHGGQRESLPWRTTHIDGYEIWIGRNAKSNDQLTKAAHKEDVWLHARGAGGSHVVIRMENRKSDPPPSVLRRTAAYAAWYSKLKGSALAPVIVTRKKYLSKPKGAPAGSVRISREEVLMVAPKKPEQ